MWNIEKWKILTWYPNKMQQYCQLNPKCGNWLWTNFQMQVALIDLSQSDVQILCGLQMDNGIWQCVNISWTGIFKKKFMFHGQYIRFGTLLLISIYQKW